MTQPKLSRLAASDNETRRFEPTTKKLARPRRTAVDWPVDCRTGEACPSCGAEIVYNGTFFCSTWGLVPTSHASPGWCGWAMPISERGPLYQRCVRGVERNQQWSRKR